MILILILILKFKIFIMKIPKYWLFIFWSKLLSLSLYAMLKLSKTTSPQKLSHCNTHSRSGGEGKGEGNPYLIHKVGAMGKGKEKVIPT